MLLFYMLFDLFQLQNKKHLLKLSCETLKRRAPLRALIETPVFSQHAARCTPLADDEMLQLVVAYELCVNGKVKSANRSIKQFVQAAAEEARKEYKQILNSNTKADEDEPTASIAVPRYARVNTLVCSISEAIERLVALGYVQREDRIASRKAFRVVVDSMEQQQFFCDRHIPELLVFHSRVDLHALPLVVERALILQDKASCLPAHLLAPPPGAHVLDACAAPGMKTSHLAALIQNIGSILAFDRDERRFHTLKATLAGCDASIVTAINEDFLKQDTAGGKQFEKIEYALVDPPCSGSGMVKRNEYLDDNDSSPQIAARRLESLANLQAMMLKHALQMPRLRRLVYSTCSIHERENEAVVAEVLDEAWIRERFELVEALPRWKNRGLGEHHKFASCCLRADPRADRTNGFFVAVFERRNHQAQ